MRLRLVVLSLTLLVALLVGFACTAASDPATDNGNLSTIGADEIVGTLAYGQTSAPMVYTATPRYRAFAFIGNALDNVDIVVHTADGQAMTWLQSPNSANVADDFAMTHDSHLTATLPTSGTYLIVFRDATLSTATFEATLNILLDGGVIDGGLGLDATIDGTVSSDGGVTQDATSDVMCTLTVSLQFTDSGACNCPLPEAGTLSRHNVPILIDDAGPGVPDFQSQDADALFTTRVLHIQSPTLFSSFGCPGGTEGYSLQLEGTPPSETWTETDASWASSFVYGCAVSHIIAPSGLPTSTTVMNGNQVWVELHYAYEPFESACPSQHGCVLYLLDCSGPATATVH